MDEKARYAFDFLEAESSYSKASRIFSYWTVSQRTVGPRQLAHLISTSPWNTVQQVSGVQEICVAFKNTWVLSPQIEIAHSKTSSNNRNMQVSRIDIIATFKQIALLVSSQPGQPRKPCFCLFRFLEKNHFSKKFYNAHQVI